MRPNSDLRRADFSQAQDGIACEECVVKKQIGRPHTMPSTRVSSLPFETCFSDVTGNASDGFHVTLLDEASKWVAPMALVHKTSVYRRLLLFLEPFLRLNARQGTN